MQFAGFVLTVLSVCAAVCWWDCKISALNLGALHLWCDVLLCWWVELRRIALGQPWIFAQAKTPPLFFTPYTPYFLHHCFGVGGVPCFAYPFCNSLFMAKEKKFSVTHYLNTKLKPKEGKYPVYIRLVYDRKMNTIASDIDLLLTESEFNAPKKNIKKLMEEEVNATNFIFNFINRQIGEFDVSSILLYKRLLYRTGVGEILNDSISELLRTELKQFISETTNLKLSVLEKLNFLVPVDNIEPIFNDLRLNYQAISQELVDAMKIRETLNSFTINKLERSDVCIMNWFTDFEKMYLDSLKDISIGNAKKIINSTIIAEIRKELSFTVEAEEKGYFYLYERLSD